MTRLINSNVTDMINQVNKYKKTIQDAFYELYKNIFQLTRTNNFRGEGAEAYKEYLTKVTINYINAFLNISEEVSITLNKMNSNYISLESSPQGSIDTEILKDVTGKLGGSNINFKSLAKEIEWLNQEASNYIYVRGLNTLEIEEQYGEIDKELYNIGKELIEVDSRSLKEATNLMNRIKELSNQLKAIANEYHANNKIAENKLKKLTTEKWYIAENDAKLSAMMKEDPYCYDARLICVSEGQWARGYASDTYIYAGYSKFYGAYTYSQKNGVRATNTSFSVFNAYKNVQFTDYLKENTNLFLVPAAYSGKVGISKEFTGIEQKASIALVDANDSVVLGTEKFNGYIKANATALSASGYANANYNASNGDFNIGLGGKVTAAEASVTMGTSFFSVPGNKESNTYAGGKVNTTTSRSLLGFSVTGKAGGGASEDFNISRTKVVDFGKVSLNAVNIKLGGSVGFGLNVDITVPQLRADMPWEK